MNIHFSSATDLWATPIDLYQELDAQYHFTLDPCSTHENAKCAKHFTKAQDGLAQSWDDEIVFLNPPYGREIGKWIAKAVSSKAIVVMLLPARTDTRWFHDHLYSNPNVQLDFLKGRLKFGDSTNSAPFPSLIAHYQWNGHDNRARTLTRDPVLSRIFTTPTKQFAPGKSLLEEVA